MSHLSAGLGRCTFVCIIKLKVFLFAWFRRSTTLPTVPAARHFLTSTQKLPETYGSEPPLMHPCTSLPSLAAPPGYRVVAFDVPFAGRPPFFSSGKRVGTRFPP